MSFILFSYNGFQNATSHTGYKPQNANTKSEKSATKINGMYIEKKVYAGRAKLNACPPIPEFAQKWKTKSLTYTCFTIPH